MMQNFEFNIIPGSAWYLVSMTWIQQWEKYANSEGKEKHPGKVNNSDIINICYKTQEGQETSSPLFEIDPEFEWHNFQLKHGLQEDKHFKAVDQNVYKFWIQNYGNPSHEIKRYAVQHETGDVFIEYGLKPINVFVLPYNKSMWKELAMPLYAPNSMTIH